jgi:hypothetical protein
MNVKILIVVLIALQSIVWATAAEDVDYYAVIMEGAKVGYSTHSRTEANNQVTTTETVDMTINRMGIALNVKTSESCVETVRGEPISFSAMQDMGLGAMKTEGTVGRDGMVRVAINGTDAQPGSNFAWPKGAVMSEGLRLIEMEKGLKEGLSYGVKVFSPGIMAAVDSNIAVGAAQNVDLLGRIVKLTKVETTMSMPGMGEIKTVSFMDEKLRALKTVMPMAGMNIELVACEKAYALGDNETLDIVDKMFVTSPEPLEDVGSAKSITYYLKPAGNAGNFTIPANDNQRVSRQQDGTVKVVIEPVKAQAGVRFPYRGPDKEIVEATRPGRYLQSDDPKIIGLAKQAVGNTRDSADAARRIEAFVASYVENKSLSVGYATASEVAVSRKGDCTEFAVLCAAMCRAAGIPSRVVMGIAYVEDFGGRDGFGGHAWTEAYIGGKWVGLDSAFKAGHRGGYDAGHIALAMGNGEPADFFNIATTLGRFKLEKITVSQ